MCLQIKGFKDAFRGLGLFRPKSRLDVARNWVPSLQPLQIHVFAPLKQNANAEPPADMLTDWGHLAIVFESTASANPCEDVYGEKTFPDLWASRPLGPIVYNALCTLAVG